MTVSTHRTQDPIREGGRKGGQTGQVAPGLLDPLVEGVGMLRKLLPQLVILLLPPLLLLQLQLSFLDQTKELGSFPQAWEAASGGGEGFAGRRPWIHSLELHSKIAHAKVQGDCFPKPSSPHTIPSMCLIALGSRHLFPCPQSWPVRGGLTP